jgi:hypothetical protein
MGIFTNICKLKSTLEEKDIEELHLKALLHNLQPPNLLLI